MHHAIPQCDVESLVQDKLPSNLYAVINERLTQHSGCAVECLVCVSFGYEALQVNVVHGQ
jgi:hypothetical protein